MLLTTLISTLSLYSSPPSVQSQDIDTFFVQWKDGVDKNAVLSMVDGIDSVEHYSHIPNLSLVNMDGSRSMRSAVALLSNSSEVEFVEACDCGVSCAATA